MVYQPPIRLILASRSPRRRELLEAAGYRFEVIPPGDEAECGVCSRATAAELVARLAYQKAADVAAGISGGLVLACDTVAECDGQILGKPADEDHAREMLQTLSGREHRVLSGLCLWPKKGPGSICRNGPEAGTMSAWSSHKLNLVPFSPAVRVAVTTLRMDRLSPSQLDDYLASGQWEGKAGAFGYQDRLGWVHIRQGSPTNVVGLPMELLEEMLGQM